MKRALALLTALAIGLTGVAPAASEGQPIFRYKSSALGGVGGETPGGGGPATPGEEQAPEAVPAFLRVSVNSFASQDPASIAEVSFTRGAARIAPLSHSIAGNSVAGQDLAFDGNVSTVWNGAADRRSATFVYQIPEGANPDHLEIVSGTGSAPGSFTIERSVDNNLWAPIVAYSGEDGWAQGEKRRYPFKLMAKPAVGDPNGRKFWRVTVDAHNFTVGNANPGVAEIKFLDKAGNDITVGGTPRAEYFDRSKTTGTNGAFDKHLGIAWSGNHTAPEPYALSYEFPARVSVASVDIHAFNYFSAKPQSIRIESSDDGRAWTIEAIYRGQGKWLDHEVRNYRIPAPKPKPGEHQYWRVALLDNHRTDKRATVKELAFFDEAGNSLTDKAVPISPPVYRDGWGSYPASSVADGSTSSGWVSLDPGPSWVGYILPAPAKAHYVMLTGSGKDSPRDIAIEWSDDGQTWTRTSTHRGHGSWATPETRRFDVGGPPPTPSDHYRFWRLAIEETGTVSSQAIRLMSMEMLDASGTNLLTAGVPSSSDPSNVSYTIDNVFDGVVRGSLDYWQGLGKPAWVEYELPVGIKPSAIALVAEGANAPRSFTVQRSADGEEWTSLVRYSGQGGWARDRRVYPLSKPAPLAGHHTFWRALVSANNGGSELSVAEVTFRDAGGQALSGKGFGIESSAYLNHSNYMGPRAFDGSLSTYWQSAALPTAASPQWVGYEFDRPVSPTTMELTSNNSNTARNRTLDPRDFQIQYSDDGTNWTTTSTYAGETGWTQSQIRSYPVHGAPPAPDQPPASAATYVLEIVTVERPSPEPWPPSKGSRLAVHQIDLTGGSARRVVTSDQPMSSEQEAAVFEQGNEGSYVLSAGLRSVTFQLAYPDGGDLTGMSVDIAPGCFCDASATLSQRVGGSVRVVEVKQWNANEFYDTGRNRK